MTSREITELVNRTFNVAESDARIEAARRNVDMTEVALEQWEIWFQSGQYRRAAQWWQSEVQGAK